MSGHESNIKFYAEPFCPEVEKVIYIYGPKVFPRIKHEIDVVVESEHASKATFLCADCILLIEPPEVMIHESGLTLAKVLIGSSPGAQILPIGQPRDWTANDQLRGVIVFGNLRYVPSSGRPPAYDDHTQLISDELLTSRLAGVPVTGGVVPHTKKSIGPIGYYLAGPNIRLHNLLVTDDRRFFDRLMRFRNQILHDTSENASRIGLIFGAVAPQDSDLSCYLQPEMLRHLREAFPTTMFAGFGTKCLQAGTLPHLHRFHTSIISIISVTS